MKKSEKKDIPPGSRVMISGVGITMPATLVRYLSKGRALVRGDGEAGMMYDVATVRIGRMKK